MPNYDFISPIFLTIFAVYLVTFSIRAYDIGILHSIREGNIVRPLGNWVGIFHWIGWASAIALLILNWKFALVVFVVRFFLRFIGVLQLIGFLILYPFLPKVPENVSNEHLEVAKAITVWQSIDKNTPKEKAHKIHDYVIEKFRQLILMITTIRQ